VFDSRFVFRTLRFAFRQQKCFNISMIITISGNLGAGKTTLAAGLSKELHYEELHIGGVMRELAAEQKMTIEEFYERLKHNPELERTIDERQEKMMREKDDLIVQGRVAWFFATGSPFKIFNIFLAVDPRVGAGRTLRRPENNATDAEALLAANAKRFSMEQKRYRALYDIDDFTDSSHYNLVLDTTELTEQEVLEKILSVLPL
jgi:predicted cytidylate kinase